MRYFRSVKIRMLENVVKNSFMQKICVACSISICLSTLVYAAEDENQKANLDEANKNYYVVGIYGGASIMEMSSEYYNKTYEFPGDYDKNLFGVSYGAKLGYDMYFLKRHGVRLYLNYMHSYLNSNEQTLGTFSMHTIGLNADYRFVILGGLSAFAGVGLAHNIINTQHLGNMSAFGGSVNLGIAYTLSFLEFELGLRYLVYDISDKSSSYLPTILGQTTTYHLVSLSSPINFNFGINFRF